MTKAHYFRAAILIAAALAAGGCSVFNKGKHATTPVLGERIAVLTSEGDAQVDPALLDTPMTLPDPVANADWAQSGGTASKAMGQVALGATFAQAWDVQGGRGSSVTMRLASAPIVANGRVYTIDSLGAVRSFDIRNGGQIWASQTPDEKGNERALYGGGGRGGGDRVEGEGGRSAARRADRGWRRHLRDERG